MSDGFCMTCKHAGGARVAEHRAVCNHPELGWANALPWSYEDAGCTRWETRRDPVMVDEAKALWIARKAFMASCSGKASEHKATIDAVLSLLWPEENSDA